MTALAFDKLRDRLVSALDLHKDSTGSVTALLLLSLLKKLNKLRDRIGSTRRITDYSGYALMKFGGASA